MLRNIIMCFGMVFVLMTTVIFPGTLFMAMMTQWYSLQNEAQYVATSEGKYGGYTIDTDNEVRGYRQDSKMDVNVEVSAANYPVPWGTPVYATLTHNFKFKVGKVFEIETPIKLKGTGRSVSTYLDGAYVGVSYTSP